MRYQFTTLFLLLSLMAYSQQSSNTLTKLEGNWTAAGKAFNMQADITMKWEKSLGGRFHHLSYRMNMKAADGTVQTFEGTAFYKVISETELIATWFDSGGDMLPIKATVDGESLTAIWGSPEAKMGKTTYRFINDNSVEITDYIRNKDGEWKQFNKNTLNRS